MAALEKGYASFRFDRRFKGIGNLRKSSGTDDPKLFDRYNTLLDDLYADPDNHDVIKKVIDDVVTIAEVYTHFKSQTLIKVKKTTGRKLLADAFAVWLVTAPLHDDKVRGDYQGFMNQLLVIKPKAYVSDLPDLLKKYYATSTDRQAAYNHTRNAALAFLRDTEGKRSPIYLDVQDTPRFKKLKPKRRANPFTVKEVIDLCERLTPKYRDVVWSCFLYGMGPKEYMNGWHVEDDAVFIDGTKKETRKRWVPLLDIKPIRQEIHGRSFAQVLKKAAPDHVPYDLRRGYSAMIEEVGILHSRRSQYMGHSAGSMTEHYARADVAPFLVADAERINAYIKLQRKEHEAEKQEQVAKKDATNSRRRELNAEWKRASQSRRRPDL